MGWLAETIYAFHAILSCPVISIVPIMSINRAAVLRRVKSLQAARRGQTWKNL